MTVKPISLEGLENLGIDEFNRLYWKGERIATEAMIEFPTWVDWAVGLAAVATFLHFSFSFAERGYLWWTKIKSREKCGQT